MVIADAIACEYSTIFPEIAGEIMGPSLVGDKSLLCWPTGKLMLRPEQMAAMGRWMCHSQRAARGICRECGAGHLERME